MLLKKVHPSPACFGMRAIWKKWVFSDICHYSWVVRVVSFAIYLLLYSCTFLVPASAMMNSCFFFVASLSYQPTIVIFSHPSNLLLHKYIYIFFFKPILHNVYCLEICWQDIFTTLLPSFSKSDFRKPVFFCSVRRQVNHSIKGWRYDHGCLSVRYKFCILWVNFSSSKFYIFFYVL